MLRSLFFLSGTVFLASDSPLESSKKPQNSKDRAELVRLLVENQLLATGILEVKREIAALEIENHSLKGSLEHGRVRPRRSSLIAAQHAQRLMVKQKGWKKK